MNKKEVGCRLVRLRGNKTQEQVAKAVGISVSALSSYECGESKTARGGGVDGKSSIGYGHAGAL